MTSDKYLVTFSDNSSEETIKISEEQMKLLEWLDLNSYFDEWIEQFDGRIVIIRDTKCKDLTV